MDTYIGSERDYRDKFDQAEYAYERCDWRTSYVIIMLVMFMRVRMVCRLHILR